MDILLVLNKRSTQNCRVVVQLTGKSVKSKVKVLLERKKYKEAFDLIAEKAMVKSFIPPNTTLKRYPDLTLIEDLM